MKKELHSLFSHYFSSLLFIMALIGLLSLSACSTVSKGTSNATKNDVLDSKHSSVMVKNSSDRWEYLNRKVFRVNAALDKVLLKPVAKAYQFAMPELLDNGVTNFFSNIGDVSNSINNLLQLKPRDAFTDSMRVVFNSSFGLGGFLDVASEMQLEKHHEDFGQTLAKWGVGSGPYVMLPLLGPSTLRDASARMSVDLLTNPMSYHSDNLAFFAVQQLDRRADLLSVEDSLNDLSTDTYAVIRDAWLQRRAYLIRDGKADKKQQSDLIDELESLE